MPGGFESEHVTGTLDFLRRAERLKDTLRSGHTSGGREESVAEHSWRLCLMALVVGEQLADVDVGRLIKMCIVHDLGEAIHGDIPAPEQVEVDDKARQERLDLMDLLSALPAVQQREIVDLWDEYEAAQTPEARMAKALDKLETILQHNQGKNPADFDYRFNLDYGQRYTSQDPLTAELRRRLDIETEERSQEAVQTRDA